MPNRRPNHALTGTTTPSESVYAVAIHCTWSVVAPKSRWMSTTATLTIVVSRIDMNMPETSTSMGMIQPRPPVSTWVDSGSARVTGDGASAWLGRAPSSTWSPTLIPSIVARVRAGRRCA